MYYNVRVKRYPGGTVQYMFSERVKERGSTLQEERKRDGSSVERKKIENQSRRKQKIYDLARSNPFEWFVTLTFDPDKVDRFDYDSCSAALFDFTHLLAVKGGYRWVIVPEQHKNGAYHFHGLVSGDLNVVRALHPRTGEPLVDKSGRPVYNVLDYQAGFTTATPVTDQARASSYLTKYLTKDIQVPKGKKGYWASRNLAKPVEEYVVMSSYEYGEIYNAARYQKVMDTPFGSYVLCEREEGSAETVTSQQNKNFVD